MDELKNRTLQDSNIAKPDGYFRYINDVDKLATTGFKTMEALKRYADAMRFDDLAVDLMEKRYVDLQKRGMK